MAVPLPEPITRELMLVWFIHRIAEKFGEHAILKGGMALRLLDSPRHTNDLDYVFVPFTSRKDILPGLREIAGEIPGATCSSSLHSKNLALLIDHPRFSLQIEASVGLECRSRPMATTFLARKANETVRVVRIMDFDVALAHKLAAWNERRLIRDLYDAYFLFRMVGAFPDRGILAQRLSKVDSRIPGLKNRKQMTIKDFQDEVSGELKRLTHAKVVGELAPLLDAVELTGLEIKIKAALIEMLEKLIPG
jgi:hypothetical protein